MYHHKRIKKDKTLVEKVIWCIQKYFLLKIMNKDFF